MTDGANRKELVNNFAEAMVNTAKEHYETHKMLPPVIVLLTQKGLFCIELADMLLKAPKHPIAQKIIEQAVKSFVEKLKRDKVTVIASALMAESYSLKMTKEEFASQDVPIQDIEKDGRVKECLMVNVETRDGNRMKILTVVDGKVLDEEKWITEEMAGPYTGLVERDVYGYQ